MSAPTALEIARQQAALRGWLRRPSWRLRVAVGLILRGDTVPPFAEIEQACGVRR